MRRGRGSLTHTPGNSSRPLGCRPLHWGGLQESAQMTDQGYSLPTFWLFL